MTDTEKLDAMRKNETRTDKWVAANNAVDEVALAIEIEDGLVLTNRQRQLVLSATLRAITRTADAARQAWKDGFIRGAATYDRQRSHAVAGDGCDTCAEYERDAEKYALLGFPLWRAKGSAIPEPTPAGYAAPSGENHG